MRENRRRRNQITILWCVWLTRRDEGIFSKSQNLGTPPTILNFNISDEFLVTLLVWI